MVIYYIIFFFLFSYCSFRVKHELEIHRKYIHTNIDTHLTDERATEFMLSNFDMKCDIEQCDINETFISLKDAKTHYADHHNIHDGYIKCCNTKFKFQLAAKEHIEWHINPTVFQ